MDAVPIIIGILAINAAVFLAGCALALYRTLRGSYRSHRRASASATVARASHQSPR